MRAFLLRVSLKAGLFFLLLAFFASPVDASSRITVYFPAYEKILGTGEATKYYSAGPTILQRTSSGELYYLLPDHLSSTRVIADKDLTDVDYISYYPFGKLRSERPTSPKITNLYTSQKLDFLTDLYYYHARYYNPQTAHFLSADPPAGGQGPNRYAYVANNPINFNDPTGNQESSPLPLILKTEPTLDIPGIIEKYCYDDTALQQALVEYFAKHPEYNPSTDPYFTESTEPLALTAQTLVKFVKFYYDIEQKKKNKEEISLKDMVPAVSTGFEMFGPGVFLSAAGRQNAGGIGDLASHAQSMGYYLKPIPRQVRSEFLSHWRRGNVKALTEDLKLYMAPLDPTVEPDYAGIAGMLVDFHKKPGHFLSK